ncbi:MAG: hypothetical protein H6Q90_4556 [Deltaproteobacteria bacterium]|nr:hypothetical protein [Deltaproteobacteria bacterium]
MTRLPRRDGYMKVNETRLPSCDADLVTASASPRLVIEYFAGAVHANHGDWVFDGLFDGGARKSDGCLQCRGYAHQQDVPSEVEITISFERDGKAAEGLLIYKRLDKRGEYVCASVLSYAGIYL